MGFFDGGSTTQSSTMTYSNPQLAKYTAAYRGAAPWGFATLDPTATLAAMGDGTKLGGRKLGVDFKEYLKGMSADEKRAHDDTQGALDRIRQRQESGQFLTPQETDFINTSLDKAFEYAHKTGYADWEKATQMMAGGRGMRMSDTPVAEPATRELRNFELGLGSERARLGLDSTMKMSAQQQMFDESFMEFNKSLAQNRWQTRQSFLFGGGLQAAANLGYTTNQTTTMKTKMSGFQQFMAGLQMANGVSAFAGNAGSGGMLGTPSSSVGGSELGASKGWGEYTQGMSGMMSGAAAMSDRRLKTNIKRIGTHDLGIGVYSYTINGQSQFGVMADEVRQVKPEAVMTGSDGYDRVFYHLL